MVEPGPEGPALLPAGRRPAVQLAWLLFGLPTGSAAWRGRPWGSGAACSRCSGAIRARGSATGCRTRCRRSRLARTFGILGMGIDTADGPDAPPRGRAPAELDVRRSRRLLRRIEGASDDLIQALGGRTWPTTLTSLNRIITVHPVGGVPMGTSAATGVVDDHGEVFGWPGLFVTDGSAMPGAVGPNPSLTIAAFALRARGADRRAAGRRSCGDARRDEGSRATPRHSRADRSGPRPRRGRPEGRLHRRCARAAAACSRSEAPGAPAFAPCEACELRDLQRGDDGVRGGHLARSATTGVSCARCGRFRSTGCSCPKLSWGDSLLTWNRFMKTVVRSQRRGGWGLNAPHRSGEHGTASTPSTPTTSRVTASCRSRRRARRRTRFQACITLPRWFPPVNADRQDGVSSTPCSPRTATPPPSSKLDLDEIWVIWTVDVRGRWHNGWVATTSAC